MCRNIPASTVLQGSSCLSCGGSYLPALCLRVVAVYAVLEPTSKHRAAGVKLLKWCRNLSAGTVLQVCSCLSGFETCLMALCCKVVAVLVESEPICWHCAAGVQLCKRCMNLPASSVLQGYSCVSGVETYLPALCCRVVLFKRYRNLPAGTVLQDCSCLSGIETYLLFNGVRT